MPSLQPQRDFKPATPPFRVDVQLHDLLVSDNTQKPSQPTLSAVPQVLPEPDFPQHPELLSEDNYDYQEELQRALKGRRKWTRPMVLRTRCWTKQE